MVLRFELWTGPKRYMHTPASKLREVICQAIFQFWGRNKLNPWPLGLQALALPVSAPEARVARCARWLAVAVGAAWPKLGFKERTSNANDMELYLHRWIYISIYIYICVCVWLYIYMCVCVCVCVCVCACVCVCVCVCVYLYLLVDLFIRLLILNLLQYASRTMVEIPKYETYRRGWLLRWTERWLERWPSICLSIYFSVFLSLLTYLSTCLSAWFFQTSLIFELDNIQNEANLRDPLHFGTRQHQNEARLLDSQTCSMFELDNFENEASLRDFSQKCKAACWANGLVPIRFAVFPPATK